MLRSRSASENGNYPTAPVNANPRANHALPDSQRNLVSEGGKRRARHDR
jgi:hypothetical protein